MYNGMIRWYCPPVIYIIDLFVKMMRSILFARELKLAGAALSARKSE